MPAQEPQELSPHGNPSLWVVWGRSRGLQTPQSWSGTRDAPGGRCLLVTTRATATGGPPAARRAGPGAPGALPAVPPSHGVCARVDDGSRP